MQIAEVVNLLVLTIIKLQYQGDVVSCTHIHKHTHKAKLCTLRSTFDVKWQLTRNVNVEIFNVKLNENHVR